jgi:WD40 repeat protein
VVDAVTTGTEPQPSSRDGDGWRRFDVFLSHSSRDKRFVVDVAKRLREEGFEPWLDEWCLVPGTPWERGLADGLAASASCAVFVGPSDLGAWTKQEAAVALDRAATDPDFRVFLVLLPDLPEQFDPAKLSVWLRMRTWVDYRGGLKDERALQAFINAIKGLPLGPEVPVERREDICPYRGLEVFEAEHAEYFFGRDADRQRLLELLKGTRFLAVLGASGSGKSSLVRAGLVPALAGGGLQGSEDWEIAVLRPGARPLEVLAARVARLGGGAAMQKTLDGLAEDPRTLHLALSVALADRPADTRALFIVDQFEEVFTLCRDERERRMFFDNLLHAASMPDGRAVVVVTLRADFYHRCGAYAELAQQLAAQQYLVSPMDRDGLRQAIEEPARRVGLSFESGLVATVLDDVVGEPGALPLLEHALLELWKCRRGSMLTLEGYRESGGVAGAIAKRADDVFAGLTSRQQELARRTFLRLTQPGEGTEDTRRRAAFPELAAGAGGDLEPVLRNLVDARLLTVSREGDDVQVEVAHEALIRGWPLLQGWIDEDRAGLRIHNRLADAAREWERLGRGADELFRGARLAEALEWRRANEESVNDVERTFLDASRRREVRNRSLRLLALTLLVGVVAAAALTILALRGKAEAEEQRAVARSRGLASSAVAQLPFDPELSVLLAREAIDVEPTEEAVDALRLALPELRVRAVMRGHDGDVSVPVERGAFAPDGGRVVTAGGDGTAGIWNVATGAIVQRLRGHRGPVLRAVFSPDGTLVATGSADRTARIWDARSGALVHELRRHSAWVIGVAFSPDGTRVATTGGDDKTVGIWDVSTGRLLSILRGHKKEVVTAVFSPEGDSVLTASWDGTARIWSVADGTLQREFRGHTDSLASAAFAPDGARIVTTSWDGTARLWNRRTGTSLAHLRGHNEAVETASFSRDGRFLVTAGSKDARVWDAETGALAAALEGHADWVNDAAFSPDGTLVVTASDDGTARIWDAATGGFHGALRGHADAVTSAVFTPDGKRVVTASRDGTARTWDVDLGSAFRGHMDWVLTTVFSPDGRRLATASGDRTARIWDLTSGRTLMELRGHTDVVNSVAFSADGEEVVTGSGDGTARIWNGRTGHALRSFEHPRDAWVSRAALNPAGTWLVTATEGGVARIWSTRTGKWRRTLRHDDWVTDASFNSNGTRIVTASLDRTARVWDARTGRLIVVLRSHLGPVYSASFSRDGRFVITSSGDRTARIWAVPSGRLVQELRGHTARVYGAAFSPDGRFAVTVGDTTTRVWDVRRGRPLAVLRMHADVVNGVAVSPDGRLIASASDDLTARVYACLTCGPIRKLEALASRLVTRVLTPTERRDYVDPEGSGE